MSCNHAAHNWNVVYQCRNCNEIVPEEIAEGYLVQLEAENEALREYIEAFHDEDYVLWRRELEASK